MLTEEIVQRKRSLADLKDYCASVKQDAQKDKSERDKGHLKEGLYKHHFDEMIPLSRFCNAYYSSFGTKIGAVLGNQTYDAVVYKFLLPIEKVELSIPHDGAKEAQINRDVVQHGVGGMGAHAPGEDIEKLKPYFEKTAKKKSKKNYSGCIVVFFVNCLPPFNVSNHVEIYQTKLEELVEVIKQYTFNARAVYLYDIHQNKILIVQKPNIFQSLLRKILT